MSERENMQANAKLRRSRRTQKQNGAPPLPLPLPANDDKEGWKEHWKAQGQLWRTEPEIDTKRQEYLAQRRLITPNIEQGIYPFKDIEPKLSRADVEWLLATHESRGICGPVDLSDERQREREGLDLRGVHLEGEDLSHLPLARLRGGLTIQELLRAIEDEEQWDMAAVHLQEAFLIRANLQEAIFIRANLQKAILREVNLQEAILFLTNLQEADLDRANLQKAILFRANLQEADLDRANLQEAFLKEVNLQKAILREVNLQKAILREVNLQKAILRWAQLKGAYLGGVTLGNEKQVGPQFADSQWDEVNLAVKWSQVKILGDEYHAHQTKEVDDYEVAVRANRQLATVLRDKGLNEDADRFAYRAQMLQRKVFWKEKKIRQYLFSLFLALLAGYGYKPWRAFLAYFLVIIAFAIAYFIIGHAIGPALSPLGSVVFSMTSFHGRGFFPGSTISLDDPLTVLAALEAFVGLLIEVTFIATLTQRLFSK